MKYLYLPLAIFSLWLFTGCTFGYSFTGASISPESKTVSIQQFQNMASMVMPSLASTLTQAFEDKFQQQTSLNLVKDDGDLAFEGEITNYVSSPIAVTSDEYASQNRLTITIKVVYTNRQDPDLNFSRTFSAYSDYDSSSLLQTVESTLTEEIVEQLVQDVFNASVSNW